MKRIAISGLKKSGKTLFLSNFLNYFRLGAQGNAVIDPEFQMLIGKLRPFNERINKDYEIASYPIFPFSDHINKLSDGEWPDPTNKIFQYPCDLSILDHSGKENLLPFVFIDYPGEYLCDVPMLDLTYEKWSLQTITRLGFAPHSKFFKEFLSLEKDLSVEPKALIEAYQKGLGAAYYENFHYLSPIIGWRESNEQFCGLKDEEFVPTIHLQGDSSLIQKFKSSYNKYVTSVVRPFCDLLNSCEKHLFLINLFSLCEFEDQLNKAHYLDQTKFIQEVLGYFGRPLGFFQKWFNGTAIKNIHLICSKADLLHPDHRPHMGKYLQEFLGPVIDNLKGNLAHVSCDLSCASISCTCFSGSLGPEKKVTVRARDGGVEYPYPFSDGLPVHLIDLLDYQYSLGLGPAKPMNKVGLFPNYNLGAITNLLI